MNKNSKTPATHKEDSSETTFTHSNITGKGAPPLGARPGFDPSRNPYVERLSLLPHRGFVYPHCKENRGRWRDLFLDPTPQNRVRLVLEIGCSNGAFLCEQAQKSPQTAFLGMDWKYKLVFKGCEKAEKIKLNNLLFMRARGQDLNSLFAPEELSDIWVLFPDPWPKTSQQKHRLLQKPFFLQAAALLKSPNSMNQGTPKRIYFKTDHPGYFAAVAGLWGVDPFSESREKHASPVAPVQPGSKGKRNRQFLHRGYENEAKIESDPELQELFELEAITTDFWSDQAVPQQPWLELAQSQTLFERLFVKDQLPIYGMILKRKMG